MLLGMNLISGFILVIVSIPMIFKKSNLMDYTDSL